ncbi:carbohydrate-binding protein [Chitinibacter sp. S2-10]|uniref:carbohydrate-binding protein n=1 Tax=Chitinibacter sp. S2-10 TaxID=3373597 RepID=UPI003977CA00
MEYDMKCDFKRLALVSALLSTIISGQAFAASCNGVSEWSAGSAYSAGNTVTQSGALYEAKWYSTNENPSQSGEWGAWKNLGQCDNTADTAQSLELVLRHASRTLNLAPGAEDFVASACLSGEAAISGGPSSIPASVGIVYSTLTYDGNRSGWIVQFKNPGNNAISVTPRVSVTCAKGKITLAE